MGGTIAISLISLVWAKGVVGPISQYGMAGGDLSQSDNTALVFFSPSLVPPRRERKLSIFIFNT